MIDEQLDERPITKPPARWRNWWRVVEPYVSNEGTPWPRGEHPGVRVWPSKDAAETAGRRSEAQVNGMPGPGRVEYLGAYPEGERP